MAIAPNSGWFVACRNKGWELLVHSFDGATQDTIIPLPGSPAYDRKDPQKLPPDGSVSIGPFAVANDGSAVFAILFRHQQDGKKDRERCYLARWDRATQRWTEADMGPCCRSNLSPNWLEIDSSGRLVTFNRLFRSPQLVSGQFAPSGEIETDDWGEEEAKKFAGRDLWDATTNPPRCVNDNKFPTGAVFFDPTGQRFLLDCGQNKGYLLYDAGTLTPVSSRAIGYWNNSTFSFDGRWAAFGQKNDSSTPSWLPRWAASYLEKIIPMVHETIRVIRLADGKVVRELPGRTTPTLTTDGRLWTVTETSRDAENVTLIAERWSPEAPGLPWWLLMLTGGFGIAMIWVVRRGRRRKSGAP